MVGYTPRSKINIRKQAGLTSQMGRLIPFFVVEMFVLLLEGLFKLIKYILNHLKRQNAIPFCSDIICHIYPITNRKS